MAGKAPHRLALVRLARVLALLTLSGLVLSACALSVHLPTRTTGSPAPGTQGTGAAARTASGANRGGSAANTATGAEPVGPPAIAHHEVATPPGPVEQASGTADPAAALRRFATTYVNWTARTVARRLRGLAAASVGQARTTLGLQARETGSDHELARAGLANHGSVEAVARLGGSGPRLARYVVVTRERTTSRNTRAYAGLAPAWHLTVATVTRRAGGWVISGWQPES